MGSKRRQPQQSRSQVTVEAILDSVSRVVREQGAKAVTTNRIAETAGVSIGTLYQYFSNKQDIFNALHQRQFRQLAEHVEDALVVSDGSSLNDLLVGLVDVVIEERLKDPDMHRFLANTVPYRANTKEKTKTLFDAFFLAVSFHRSELRDDCDLEQFVFVLSHMIESLGNAAVLERPSTVTFEAARLSVINAIRAVVAKETR